ncbi:MAG: tetratricopeptide repeat protein [Methylacidiphilales bacterium]|nr:tetratricopeptide repeat protein [Candidatus Methylacidiphilales bacterium]
MLIPRQNVTFLFTDIERSSELWETHPQAMGRALAQHDELLRGIFSQNRGHVFKTIGDAFCVAFNHTLDAVEAATAAQRALATTAWEETGPLRVRMALHYGEAELRDGDYFGQTLNRVARVLATGHGGQTLLTFVTAEIVRAMLPADLSLRDLGERRLKDLSRPERIFQLVIKGLPTEFPPLRSLEVLPNNLPAQVTSFVGRDRDMANVKRLMGTTRLLTLTGAGGTGKTRLSLQVAAELLDQFPHGVWLVELSTLSDPALIPEAILNVFGIREEPDRPPLTTLVEALRARNLLLVLDNCEHLIAGCAQVVSTLLRQCPQVKVIASSREPLSIEGETLWQVSALTVPDFFDHERSKGFDHLEEFEAVQLFVERAAAVHPGFALTAENARLVAKICWRLDGIPLALELAAARIKVLPLDQILSRLDDRFKLLTGGSRTALPRQQTLGALIDWSYDLLTEPERILFRRLAVFVVGRTLEMAEAVCAGNGIEPGEVFDLLCSLVDKSLIMIETPSDGEARYTMIESIWDYAEEKLSQHGETVTYRRKHLEFFVNFAERIEPLLYGPEQKAALEKLHLEHHNLDFALRTSLKSQETIVLGLRLAGALTRYWEVRSYLTEGYEQFKALLARMDDSVELAIQAKAELGAGRMSWCQDRDDDALEHYHAAQRLYASVGMIERVATIETFLGFTEYNEGRNDEARQHFERALVMAGELKSERIKAMAEHGLGSLASTTGDLAAARIAKQRAIEVFQSLGDRWPVSLITGSLGRICFVAGDYPAAKKYIRDALTISRDLGNNWSVPYAVEALADISAEEHQATKAVRLYGAASAQREMLGLSFSSTEKISYQKSLDRFHLLVPDPSFQEEWEKGRSLGFQAAINLALDGEK